jgi:hypothetical protein
METYCKKCGQHITRFPPRDLEDLHNIKTTILVLKDAQKKLLPLLQEIYLKNGFLDMVNEDFRLENERNENSFRNAYAEWLNNLCDLTFKEDT